MEPPEPSTITTPTDAEHKEEFMKWHEKAGVGLLHTETHGIYKVRVYEDRIAIQAPNLDPISWEELQRVKHEVLGEVFAVEVFPAKECDVVNL